MPYLYIVRCNFTRPELEQAWNDWYSGQKIAQLLAKPMFRAVQRFRLAQGHGRNYLALWQVDSPDAFGTSEYRSDWGFAEWSRYIVDWSRELFDATGTQGPALAVPLSGALQVISFDAMEAQQAATAQAALGTRADMLWCTAAGLDRHTPMIGLQPHDDAAAAQSLAVGPLPAGVQAGLYRPICEFSTAETPARVTFS